MEENEIIETARNYDRLGDPVNAYTNYLLAITNNQADLDDYINVSVIMFLFQDAGYSIEHNVPDDMGNDSWLGMFKTLEECESKFCSTDELMFWKKYFNLILLGHDEYGDECDKYMAGLKSISKPINEKWRYVESLK